MSANTRIGEKEAGETQYTCQACSSQLSPRSCLPFILPCHHTICATCISRLRRGICPTCTGSLPSSSESSLPSASEGLATTAPDSSLPLNANGSLLFDNPSAEEDQQPEACTFDETFRKLVETARSHEVMVKHPGMSQEDHELQQHLQKTLNSLVMKASLLKSAEKFSCTKVGEDTSAPEERVDPVPEHDLASKKSQEERSQSGRQSRKKRNRSNKKKRAGMSAAENSRKAESAKESGTAAANSEVVDDPCENHPNEQLRFYCRTCQTPLCRICVKDHNERVGHELVDIQIAAEEARKEMLVMCGDLERIQNMAQERVHDLQANLAKMDAGHEQAMEEVNQHFTDVIAIIRQREAEVLSEIESKVAQQRSQLENYVDDLRSLQSAVDTTSAMGRRLAAVGGDSDAFQRRFDHLHSLIEAVPDPPELEPLINIDEVQVNALHELISRMGEIETYYDTPTETPSKEEKRKDN